MPFYIRKSISAGPFRFNLSKSGVGLSVGVRGFRIGTGPRGHYVHAGRGGLYYRSSLGRAGERRPRAVGPRPGRPGLAPDDLYHPTVDMVEVESADVMAMADSRFQTILDDLNGRAGQFRLSMIAAAAGFLLWAVSGFSLWGLAAGLLAVGAGAYVDSYRRSSVVFYDLEGPVHDAYLVLVGTFETLAACAGKWHIAAGGAIRDLDTWKRNAGAAHLVKKSPTPLAFRLPAVLKSNVTPPMIGVGKQLLFLLPDMILVGHDGRFGAVAYEDLCLASQYSRFIEDGPVPADAKVVDRTWRYVNKGGGPDRRFKDNRELPICLYETMHLTSSSGLNELLEFSRTDVCEPFAAAVRGLASALKAKASPRGGALPAPSRVPPGRPPAASELWRGALYGMSVDEVSAVVPAARPGAADSVLGDGSKAELEVPSVEALGAPCRLLFYFRAGSLIQVTLAYGAEAPLARARAIVAVLTADHGAPLSFLDADTSYPLPTMQADWLLPSGVTIALAWLRGVALNVNYQFHSDDS